MYCTVQLVFVMFILNLSEYYCFVFWWFWFWKWIIDCTAQLSWKWTESNHIMQCIVLCSWYLYSWFWICLNIFEEDQQYLIVISDQLVDYLLIASIISFTPQLILLEQHFIWFIYHFVNLIKLFFFCKYLFHH